MKPLASFVRLLRSCYSCPEQFAFSSRTTIQVVDRWEKKEKLEKVEVIPVASPSGHSPTSGVVTNTWPHVSSAPTSDLEPPKPVWNASRGTSTSSSYLPTIALGDLVLTTGSGQGEAVTTDPGGGEVTWTVDTGVTDHGEVIFVQASEPSDKN